MPDREEPAMKDFLFELYCCYMDWFERTDWAFVLLIFSMITGAASIILMLVTP